MVKQDLVLNNKEKWLTPHTISKSKLESHAQRIMDKLLILDKKFDDKFPATSSRESYEYDIIDHTNWVSGLYTGMFWLAYELSGDKIYREIAEKQLKAYKRNIETLENIHDHDVGFTYSPSCVAAYKLTGNEDVKKFTLDTVKFYYDHSWCKDGKFIIRGYRYWERGGNRTMMDALMNAPLLMWAGKEIGNEDYLNAGHQQSITTGKYLIREDGSSYHHYQFDQETCAPEKGLTHQGFSDESTWSRGHAWGVYGFPICYSYTGDESMIALHRNVTYYMLNHLPDSLIPAWDFIFPEPNDEVRDTSAAVIAACGMNEMSRHLADDNEDKQIFTNASNMLLEAVMDNYTAMPDEPCDGMITHVTGAKPQGLSIEKCALYGDYYFFEAIMRLLNPDWKMYW